MSQSLEIMARPCDQCLTTKNRIVSGERAAQIVRDCRASQNHFVCHKSPAGRVIHCRGVHDVAPSHAYRFASVFDIPIVDIEPTTLEPVNV